RAARVRDGAQVGHDDFDLEILKVVGRHASTGNAVLDDLDQVGLRVALAELAVTEIDARHLVALRAVAENAVGAEQPLAFQYVRGRIVTLAQQRPGSKGKKRKPNRPHTRSPFRRPILSLRGG